MKVMVKSRKKMPAPAKQEQARDNTNADIIRKCKSGFLAEYFISTDSLNPKLLSEIHADMNASQQKGLII